MRERKRPESPQQKGPSVTETWVHEEELEIWEIRMFGEKKEKEGLLVKQKAAEQLQKENAERIKKQMEEQLKKQREAFTAKKQAEAAKAGTPLTINPANTITINNSNGKFTSIIQRGTGTTKRIFTSRGISTPNQITPVTPRPSTPPQFATVRTSQGQTFRIPLSMLQGKKGQPIIIRNATAATQAQTIVTQSPTITNQVVNRATTPTTFVLRTPAVGGQPIILANQIRPSVTAQPAVQQQTQTQTTTQTQQTQQVQLQRQIQLPVRLADGRVQVVQIPISSVGNQPIQIAINTQSPGATSTPQVITNSIQIVTSSATGPTIVQQQPQQPQFRIVTNTTGSLTPNATGQPVVAKLVQLKAGGQPIPQTIQIPQQQLTQLLQQQLQGGKIQLKLNTPEGTTVQQQDVNIQNQTPTFIKLDTNTQIGQKIIVQTIDQNVNDNTSASTSTSSPTKSTTGSLTAQSPEKKFVITPEMQQDILRQAMMNPNVPPEIQQKLMALQRHHQEQKEQKEASQKQKTITVPISNPTPTVNRSRQSSGSRSIAAKNSRAKQKQVQAQMSPEEKEEAQIHAACQSVIRSIIDKIERDEKNLAKKQKVRESIEERRQRQNMNRLQNMLLKHTELLKKDIAKKRALLEKELKQELRGELGVNINTSHTNANAVNSVSKPPAQQSTPKRPTVNVNKRKINHVINNSADEDEFDDEFIRPPKQNKKQKYNLNTSSPSPSTSISPKKQRISQASNHHNKGMNSYELYCVCKKPYDPAQTTTMVQCDSCYNWFHIGCVGLTEAQAKKMAKYCCPNCDKTKIPMPNEQSDLYCLCRQPYDESQFYICCDRCQDWFHGRCVGVLQSEADAIDEYVCPNCQSDSNINYANLKQLESKDIENLRILIKALRVSFEH